MVSRVFPVPVLLFLKLSVVLQPTIYEEKNRYTHNEIEQILRRWFLLVVHKKIGDCSIFLQSPIIFFNMKYILTDF